MFLVSKGIIFFAGGQKAVGSTETVFACALAEGGRTEIRRWRAAAGRAVAILDQSDVVEDEVSASNSPIARVLVRVNSFP